MPSRGMAPRGGHMRGGHMRGNMGSRGGAMSRGGPANRGNMHRGGGPNHRGHFQQVSSYILQPNTLLFKNMGYDCFLKEIFQQYSDQGCIYFIENSRNINIYNLFIYFFM